MLTQCRLLQLDDGKLTFAALDTEKEQKDAFSASVQGVVDAVNDILAPHHLEAVDAVDEASISNDGVELIRVLEQAEEPMKVLCRRNQHVCRILTQLGKTGGPQTRTARLRQISASNASTFPCDSLVSLRFHAGLYRNLLALIRPITTSAAQSRRGHASSTRATGAGTALYVNTGGRMSRDEASSPQTPDRVDRFVEKLKRRLVDLIALRDRQKLAERGRSVARAADILSPDRKAPPSNSHNVSTNRTHFDGAAAPRRACVDHKSTIIQMRIDGDSAAAARSWCTIVELGCKAGSDRQRCLAVRVELNFSSKLTRQKPAPIIIAPLQRRMYATSLDGHARSYCTLRIQYYSTFSSSRSPTPT
jgi:hypothetical protein